MARPGTVTRVHAAVLDLATEHGPAALTMERIAATAGVGKQTLYRSWPSVTSVLFDALLARSAPRPGDDVPAGCLQAQVESLMRAAIAEISTEPNATLLRALAAAIQTDERVAREYRSRLLDPQLDQVHTLLRSGGCPDPARTAELLLAPVFYRWFMRLPAMDDVELSAHVAQVLGAADPPAGRSAAADEDDVADRRA